MNIKVNKLSAHDADTCVYQLMVYRNVVKSVKLNDQSALQPKVDQVSIFAKIDPSSFIIISEETWVRLFKSCLKEYKKLNSTIRQDQLLSNLAFATRGYGEHVNFTPLQVAHGSQG